MWPLDDCSLASFTIPPFYSGPLVLIVALSSVVLKPELLLPTFVSLPLSSATRPYCLCKALTAWYMFIVPANAVLGLWTYHLYWACVSIMCKTELETKWFLCQSFSWPSSNSLDDTNQIKNGISMPVYLSAISRQCLSQIFRSEQ